MEIIFSPKAIEDLNYWKQKQDKKILFRIRDLLGSIQSDPFRGIGKPEPLRFNLAGKWSRRISKEHRIVYEVVNKEIIVHALKEHY